MARVRLGFAFEERARERLARLADKAGLSQNQALEALIVGRSEQDTLDTMALGTELLKADKDVRVEVSRSLAKLTDHQRAAIMAAIKDQE